MEVEVDADMVEEKLEEEAEEEEKEEEKEEDNSSDKNLTVNNPHLAGGEKTGFWKKTYKFVGS